ncbi:uncharacterized protein N7459_007073 [Penicillium hispanicum]|uniref:uncharacterized protein n=1 Tax=Penicillium hispanicum TaxID=1080232 RepID=UPI00253FD537|nr:uncharacterized protein N7459_007073 [Penicillium hispanicum]KAJ5578109.1 hypothetical protein N7459_007073 [Penicillium hispanicum]
MKGFAAEPDWFQRPPSLYPTEVYIDPDRQTRVLSLQPGSGEDELRCQLFVQDLETDSQADYDALSYVWGDWWQKGAIRANGIAGFPVTLNLFRALRRLRDKERPVLLWIDQVSINQQDKDERKRQVKQIGPIFRKARRVITWFGDVDQDICSARGDEEKRAQRAFRSAITNKLTDKWWTRAWVIEEYALARDDPILMFGPFQIPWSRAESLETKRMNNPLGELTQMMLHMSDYEYLRSDTFERNLHSLSVILNETSTLNPLDKVYCILASLPEKERAQITPDYNRSVSEVFAHATYVSIAASGSLGILSLASKFPSPQMEYPATWAVDFTFPDRDRAVRFADCAEGGLLERVNNALTKPIRGLRAWLLLKIFDFHNHQRGWCKRHPHDIAEPLYNSSDPRRLALNLVGLEFDQVQFVTGVDRSVDLRTNFRPGAIFVEGALNFFVPTSTSSWASWLDTKTLNSMERDLCAAIQERVSKANPYQLLGPSKGKHTQPLLSRIPKDKIVRFTMINALFRAWDKAARPRNARPIFEPAIESLPEILQERKRFQQEPEDEEGPFEFVRIVLFKLLLQMNPIGFKFFVTPAGFIGLGPPDLRPNDTIVLMYGSRFPVALRPAKNGRWNFVGFVYVRGVMEAELWDCFSDLELREMEFVLE